MIYETKNNETYLFMYDTEEDYCCTDEWIFDSLEEAKLCAKNEFNIAYDTWIEISDPDQNCQHDWIQQTRRVSSNPENPEFEIFKNGNWQLYKTKV